MDDTLYVLIREDGHILGYTSDPRQADVLAAEWEKHYGDTTVHVNRIEPIKSPDEFFGEPQ